DNVLGIYVTAAMKERGEYQIQFLQTRSSNGVGKRVYLKFDPASLRIDDMPGEDQPQLTGVAAVQQDRHAKRQVSAVKPNMGTSVKLPNSNIDESEEDEAPKAFQREEMQQPKPPQSKTAAQGAHMRTLMGRINKNDN